MRNVNENTVAFRRYRTQVDKVVQQCSIIARNLYKWDAKQWAFQAGVSYTTLDNLLGRVTRFPQVYTLYRLASAIGCEIWVNEVVPPGRKLCSEIKKRKLVKH